MIETIKYRLVPDTGAEFDAFEGLNEEADARMNELLEDGYREVFRETVPPESGRYNYLVVVKLWKTDETTITVAEVAAMSREADAQFFSRSVSAGASSAEVVDLNNPKTSTHPRTRKPATKARTTRKAK